MLVTAEDITPANPANPLELLNRAGDGTNDRATVIPRGKVGQPYTHSFLMQGGISGYTENYPNSGVQTTFIREVRHFGGRLPAGAAGAGMNITRTGVLSGTPTEAGVYHLRLELFDEAYEPKKAHAPHDLYWIVEP